MNDPTILDETRISTMLRKGAEIDEELHGEIARRAKNLVILSQSGPFPNPRSPKRSFFKKFFCNA